MPFKSQWDLDYPKCSLPTLVFKDANAKLPQKPILIDSEDPDNHYLTLDSYRLLCQRLAVGLQHNVFKKHDRLLIFSGNNIYFPSVLMGTVMAGGIFTGANPGYVTRELAYQLQNSEARFLLCSEASLDVGLEAAKQISLPLDRVYYFNNSMEPAPEHKGCKHWTSLLASEEEGRRYQWDSCTKPGENEQTIVLNYSSGTTGVPKGVEITHRNYVSNVTVQNFLADLKENTPELLESARGLCFVPLYHAMGQTNFCASAPLRGTPVYVMPKFEFEKVLENIERFKITALSFVPPVVVAFAKHPDVRRWKWDLSSVRDIMCGAAPLGRPASEEMESVWKGKPQEKTINVRQGWGMTELTCTATTCHPGRFHTKASVGELAPGVEARIIKEDGSGEGKINERGEIWIRGPNVMKGYWRNPAATKETLTEDGWLMTGDIAYMDELGDVYIVDRKKELIKVKGNQVAPAELEALLLEHPAITDVAVIGVPRDGDEAPRAYVCRTAGHDTTESQIVEWMNQRVSRTKRLNGGVRFIDEIPKNPSGKILRRQLRDLAAKTDSQQSRL